jgi:hypothetical protein
MSNEINSYNLSREWFNFCFENPDIITPNHSALYFFAIEHCNRLGWKKKFGLPTTMAKEAIGIRSYNTYIKTLNDLIEFGFIKLIEKSRNQYSSNIVALSKSNKALDKALDKALIKHDTKQSESTVQSIDSIIKQITNNNITIKPITTEQREILLNFVNNVPIKNLENKTWRENFEIYKSELRENYKKLIADSEFISEQEKFHPGVDIKLSLEKACTNFWATEAGWKNKKGKKTKNIDWKTTLVNAIDKSKVYKPKSFNPTDTRTQPDMKNFNGKF